MNEILLTKTHIYADLNFFLHPYIFQRPSNEGDTYIHSKSINSLKTLSHMHIYINSTQNLFKQNVNDLYISTWLLEFFYPCIKLIEAVGSGAAIRSSEHVRSGEIVCVSLYSWNRGS